MLMMTIVLAAGILVYALHRKRNVKVNVKLFGANVSLEAKDDTGPDSRGCQH